MNKRLSFTGEIFKSMTPRSGDMDEWMVLPSFKLESNVQLLSILSERDLYFYRWLVWWMNQSS